MYILFNISCNYMQAYADCRMTIRTRLVKTSWQEMLRPRIAERCCHERRLTDPFVHRFYCANPIRHLFRLAAMGDVAAVGQETFRITVSANTSCWMSKAHYVSNVSWITNEYNLISLSDMIIDDVQWHTMIYNIVDNSQEYIQQNWQWNKRR